jgi:hypothetical protein
MIIVVRGTRTRRADLRSGPGRPMASHRQPGRRRRRRVAVYASRTARHADLCPRQGGDRRRRVGDGRFGQPQRRSWTRLRGRLRGPRPRARPSPPGRPGWRATGPSVRPPAAAAPVAGTRARGCRRRRPAAGPGRRPRPVGGCGRAQAWHDGGNRGPGRRTGPAPQVSWRRLKAAGPRRCTGSPSTPTAAPAVRRDTSL